MKNILKDIFVSGLKFDGSVLLSGSAGLAKYFPSINNKDKELKSKRLKVIKVRL